MACSQTIRVACLLFAALAAGCGKKPSVSPAEFVAGLHQGEPITAAECEEAGKRFIDAIKANNLIDMRMSVDFDSLIGTALAGIDASGRDLREYRAGVASSLESSLLASLVAQSSNGGSVEVLRGVPDQSPPRVRLRLLPGGGGVAYLDLHLARRSGIVRVVDLYNFALGSSSSETIRRLALPFFAQRNAQGLLDRLKGADVEIVKHSATIQRLGQAVQNQDHAGVIAAYRALPPELQAEKAFMVQWASACSQTSDEQYVAALEKVRGTFPNDPSSELLSIDYFTLKGQYPEAFDCVDSLDKAVGGDPYLDSFRAGLHTMAGNHLKAKEALERVVASDPANEANLRLLVDACLAAKDFSGLRQRLEQLASTFGADIQAQLMDAKFAEFLESPVYQDWLKAGGPPKPTPQPPTQGDPQAPDDSFRPA